MRKAQLLTVDFVLSLAIFISIILTLVSVWSTFDTQIRDVENRRELQTLSLAISDVLVRSPGHPDNWGFTDVQSIGFAKTERVLDLAKIREFMKMDYYNAKSKLRLGGLGTGIYENKTFDFQLFITDNDGNNLTTGLARSPVAYYAENNGYALLLNKINDSGLVWDLYWGWGPLPGAQRPRNRDESTYSRRTFYNSPASPSSEKDVLNTLISNQASYRTIIIEYFNAFNPEKYPNSEINISGLQQFVSRGGILVVIGRAKPGYNLIDQNFSVHGEFDSGGWGDGVVQNPWHLLPNGAVGQAVLPGAGFPFLWYFHSLPGDAKVNVIASVGAPDQGLICYWDYGFGRIYYIEDLAATLQDGGNVLNEAEVIGKPIKFGLSPSLPSQVITITRTTLLEGFDREPVSMVLRVWR